LQFYHFLYRFYKTNWVKSFDFGCDFTIFDFSFSFDLKQNLDFDNCCNVTQKCDYEEVQNCDTIWQAVSMVFFWRQIVTRFWAIVTRFLACLTRFQDKVHRTLSRTHHPCHDLANRDTVLTSIFGMFDTFQDKVHRCMSFELKKDKNITKNIFETWENMRRNV